MPTPTKGPRLGGGPAHERLMLANLATALFEHGKITTTEAKAKRLRPLAERLITKAKRGDLHARRQVLSVIRDKSVVHELFTEIGPRYDSRHGGYTRITKIGPRKGDNAPMAVIELVEALTVQQTAVREAEGATRSATKKTTAKKSAAKTAAADATSADDATEVAEDVDGTTEAAEETSAGADSESDVTSEQVEDAATEEPAEGGETDEAAAETDEEAAETAETDEADEADDKAEDKADDAG